MTNSTITITQVEDFCNNLFNTPDHKKVHEFIKNDEREFTIDNVHFIHTGLIDFILAEELTSNRHLAGSFAPCAIAKATGWPLELIETMQECGAHKKLGEAMEEHHVDNLAKSYRSMKGYGHHFENCDGLALELGDYFVFDNH